MPDRVTGLNVFSKVAALGSLSAAARTLGMSQTMATKHMAALEARLGTRLLHRTTRRITLTEAGRVYLETVERILADLEEADAKVSIETVEARGLLRLNAPVSFGIREIAPLIPVFAGQFPHVAIDLGLNDRQVDLVEEGWDLAIRIGTLKNSSLIARRIAPCRMLVCAAPTYLAKHGRPKRTADLTGHNCLGYTLSQTINAERWVFGAEGKSRVAVSGTLKANNGDALVAAAVAGQGVIYQPTFLVYREIAAGQLVPLKLDLPPHELPGIYVAYPAGRQPPAKVRAFIDFLVHAFAPRPTWEQPPRPTLARRP